jgi:glycosyltransferase involved in cell wall biosynthesis
VARLAHEAGRRGVSVQVVAPHTRGTVERQLDGEVEVRRFRYAPEGLERVAYTGHLHRSAFGSPLVMALLPAFLWAFRRAVRQAVAEREPDLIHAHWWMPGAWVAAGAGRPLVVTCHGSDVRLLERALPRLLARRTLGRARVISAVSEFLAGEIRAAVPGVADRVTVTSMPVDVEHFARGMAVPKASPPRILYAGNLLRSKGVDCLVRAFAKLQAEGRRMSLRILGEGPDRERLVRLGEELGVHDRIEWLPFRPQTAMPEEYGQATVTVLPTLGDAEGLGLVLVEALLAGSAVIGSRAGGIPEVVEDGVTGRLVTGGDVEQLAAAIAEICDDPVKRHQWTEAGRRSVQARFSPERAIEPVLAMYEEARAGSR